MLNPLAQELNETLRGSVVEALMSDMGKRMYFPNGIISQGGEAATDAYLANGTIGMAVANGSPIELDSYKKICLILIQGKLLLMQKQLVILI